jgi:HD-like signal output (HDOD) protein
MSELTAVCAPVEETRLMAADVDFEADLANMPAKLCSLPPLNSIATRVLSISSNPECDIKRLSSVIETDPAFAAEVLFLANSPLFGFPSKMEVLHRAITVLGLDRIQALAMTVAMRAFVSGGGPLVRQCWRHSAASAVIAERISSIFGVPGDQSYSAVLLHDIGRLGLVQSYPREMSPVLNNGYGKLSDVLAAEREAMRVDHVSAGAWLVKHWSLPDSFAEVCRHHHDPLQPADSDLLRLAKAACKIADTLDYSAVQYQPATSYESFVAALPAGIDRDRFPSEDELREHVKVRLASFEQ